ncbi:unnamed protein product [Effrenium voratum]|uniref:Uncharacterized protein n=1 Tax=Effrenium voratum TaxID=2562239 RepID=A0AA36I6G4_9DINO|nr:unnamed protein product [Effrenium voratum]CAJ1381924.1 unnamed protein product [Effrenium voratum]
MPAIVASKTRQKDGAERPDFWHQLSSGSTATCTPLSRDAARFEVSRSRSGSTSRFELEVPPETFLNEEDSEPAADAAQIRLRPPPGPAPSYNFRRRLYVELTSQVAEQDAEQVAEEDDEVVICGPLQQRYFGFIWRWRKTRPTRGQG